MRGRMDSPHAPVALRYALPLFALAVGGVAAAWVLAGAWLVRAGVAGWPNIPRSVRVVGGVLALALAWLALAQARVIGVNFLLSVLVLLSIPSMPAMSSLPSEQPARTMAPSCRPWKCLRQT